jgi:hypothetical protein
MWRKLNTPARIRLAPERTQSFEWSHTQLLAETYPRLFGKWFWDAIVWPKCQLDDDRRSVEFAVDPCNGGDMAFSWLFRCGRTIGG